MTTEREKRALEALAAHGLEVTDAGGFMYRANVAVGPAVVAAMLAFAAEQDWQPIETVKRENGLRLILAWDDCPTLSYHWEVGRWSATLGWVNTYGKPFGAGEPTHWMVPSDPTPATPTAKED